MSFLRSEGMEAVAIRAAWVVVVVAQCSGGGGGR